MLFKFDGFINLDSSFNFFISNSSKVIFVFLILSSDSINDKKSIYSFTLCIGT